jgi:CRP-like cAMP-binding protein
MQLFAEGDEGNRAYIIVEGEVVVVKASDDREVLLAVRGVGEVIGEMALIEATPRSATVRGKGDAKLMAIGKDQLEHLLERSLAATRAMFYTILAR